MARCGCVSECNCVLADGDCTLIAGNGNPGAPYRVNLEIDPTPFNMAVCGDDGLIVQPPVAGDCINVDDSVIPPIISVEVDGDPTNQLGCNPNGLYVPPPSVEVADTDCIDLNGTGFPGDPITATPIIDPTVENLVDCGPNGLLSLLYSLGSPCIDVDGSGSSGDPLEVSLIVSGDAGNILQCRPTGAFVPTAGAGAIDIYGHMDLFGPFISSGGTPFVDYNPWPFNRSLYDVGGIVDLPNSRFLAPAAGWYYIEAQWEDNTVANNFQAGLFGGYFQQLVGMSVSSVTPAFIPGGSVTQDRLVENPHRYRLAEVRYLDIGDFVDFFWRITNTTGAACGPMAFNPVLPAPGSSTENYAVIARIGV